MHERENVNIELQGLFAVDYADVKILVTHDLTSALRKPDSECVVLPDGSSITPCFYDININGATMSINDVVAPSQFYVNDCGCRDFSAEVIPIVHAERAYVRKGCEAI